MQRHPFSVRYGFGSYSDPAGNWHPTPLIRFAGETVIRNPVDGATYSNQANVDAAVGGNTITTFENQAAWDAYLATFSGDVNAALLNPPADFVGQRPSVLHPAEAAIVLHFYQRYLNRGPGDVDAIGLDFWTTGTVNLGPAATENAFRVSAVDQGVYTEATLPAREYGMPADPDETADEDSGDVVPGTSDGDTADGGIVENIQNRLGGLFDKLSASTGVSTGALKVGAVVAGVVALYVFNSDSTPARRR